MRVIALLIATLMVLLGLTGVLWPEGLIRQLHQSFSATGLYVIALVRMVLGALLFLAARATRTPKTMRVLGSIIFVAGIATALISVERAQLMKDWMLAHGPDTLRIAACVPLVAGLFVAGTTLTKDRKS